MSNVTEESVENLNARMSKIATRAGRERSVAINAAMAMRILGSECSVEELESFEADLVSSEHPGMYDLRAVALYAAARKLEGMDGAEFKFTEGPYELHRLNRARISSAGKFRRHYAFADNVMRSVREDMDS